jgi:Spy/CpxP family protein refolding chaperone
MGEHRLFARVENASSHLATYHASQKEEEGHRQRYKPTNLEREQEEKLRKLAEEESRIAEERYRKEQEAEEEKRRILLEEFLSQVVGGLS